MQDNLYEYAIIRFVPKVERGEFFNIGLIMFSKKQQFIRMEYHICPVKLGVMKSSIDLEEVEHNLNQFKKIAEGKACANPISQLDIPERFRWLTAVRSAAVQTSRPHPGKTKDLDKTFERLYAELVK